MGCRNRQSTSLVQLFTQNRPEWWTTSVTVCVACKRKATSEREMGQILGMEVEWELGRGRSERADTKEPCRFSMPTPETS